VINFQQYDETNFANIENFTYLIVKNTILILARKSDVLQYYY